jgi:threonine synthase
MPLPTMLLTASATMLQRPMARSNSGLGVDPCISVLYHNEPCRNERADEPTRGRGDPTEPAVPYSYATHLECSLTGERHDIGKLQGLSAAGKPLLARYDLGALRREVTRQAIEDRAPGLWRWHELLPLPEPAHILSLGEIETPLLPLTRSARPAGFRPPLVKDEGRLPTGSFKTRGLAVAVSMAAMHGVRKVAIPTNGNAGAAMAAYAARAGLEAFCFCPDDTPEINLSEIALQGAQVWRVNGLINDCARLVKAGESTHGWFDMSTLKEPYRIEGKKTMGLELAVQFGWRLPSAVFYPTGGGTGLIGMWKAWQELAQLGWLEGRLPRLVAVQAAGCAPIVRAFDNGAETAAPWENAHTLASGIRVPAALGDFLILRGLRESGGFALAVSDEKIDLARAQVASADGLLLSPEGAATYAAYLEAARSGRIAPTDEVVLFNCASGLKYPMPPVTQRMEVARPS